MLADSIQSKADLPDFIRDDNWGESWKVDGDRFLVEVNDGVLVVYGRSGQPKVSNIPFAVLGEFQTTFPLGRWVFDGEMVGRQLILFDLPVAGELVTVNSPFADRYEALHLLMAEWKPDPANIVALPVVRSAADKEAMLKEAQDQHREGVMFRHWGGLYKEGGRSRHLLKYKFVKECDAIISAVGVDGHENVVLSLLDLEGDGRIVEIGRASAIGKKPTPALGQVWEVNFLYVIDPIHPRLYQPRLMRLRTDKAMEECTFDQLADAYTDRNYTDKTRRDAP